MISQCPHCMQRLPYSLDAKNRLQKALDLLEPGKTLTIKCPFCNDIITLERSGQPSVRQVGRVEAPEPPNLDWLRASTQEDYGSIADVPMVLLLHEENQQREEIVEHLKAAGYQCLPMDDLSEGLERMRFVDFSCVIFQAGLDGPLEQSGFHHFMRRMSMDRRRHIFYVLVGDQLHTLYALEALSLSANLTVNTSDLPYLDAILRRSLLDYEGLFGPFLEELRAAGRR